MTDAGVLSVLHGSSAHDDLERIVAAAGLRIVHQPHIARIDPKAWTAAVAVLLDAEAARRCADRGLARRPAVFVIGHTEPEVGALRAALAVGAQQVLQLPAEENVLLRAIGEAVRNADGPRRGATGRVLAVVSGHGGAGGSLLAATLARRCSLALLVDLDHRGGGLDLLLGRESDPGLRWPDITGIDDGGLDWPALRAALPGEPGLGVLSVGRGAPGPEPAPGAVAAVLDAGLRGGVTVVCDVPRWPTPAGRVALGAADLVVLVAQATVRGAAAAAGAAAVLRVANPNVGMVVRGPAPGGLRAADIAAAAEVPLLAAMRPEPMLAERLERGGLRTRARGPLTEAADWVLATLDRAGAAGLVA